MDSQPVMHRRPTDVVRWTGLLLLAALAGGCGQGEYEPTDADRLSGLVSSLSDAAGDAEAFRSFFAEGAAPPESERARYKSYNYYAESPKISGDSATAATSVKDFNGNAIGEVSWSAVREAGQWKLKAAPLP